MSVGRKHPKYEEITSKWGGMKVREEFEGRITNWLKVFPQEEHPFLLELLSHFSYYCEEKIPPKVIDLHNFFLNKYQLNKNDLVYTKIIKEFGSAHSDIFFSEFWLRNKLNSMAENEILNLLEEDAVPPVIVFVDDYSGTGDSFVKSVEKMITCNERVRDSSLYFITLHMTEIAKRNISTYADENQLNIVVDSLDWSDEIFKENYVYTGIDSLRKKQEYMRIYEKLGLKDYPLGYKEVSSLVAFYYNTPNDTLGLFWQNLNDFVALFNRDEKEQCVLSKLQRQARNRKSNREQKAIYGVDSSRQEVMLCYILVKGKKFLMSDFVKQFGITSEQGSAVVKKMVEDGLLTISDEILVASDSLKEHMFKSRVSASKVRFENNVNNEACRIDAHEEYLPLKF